MLWDTSSGPIDRYNVWRRAISFSFFLRRSTDRRRRRLRRGSRPRRGDARGARERRATTCCVLLEAGLHDPLRALALRPSRVPAAWPAARPSARPRMTVASGTAEVLRRHRYPLWFAAFRVLQLVLRARRSLLPGVGLPTSGYYLAMARGRFGGFFGCTSASG